MKSFKTAPKIESTYANIINIFLEENNRVKLVCEHFIFIILKEKALVPLKSTKESEEKNSSTTVSPSIYPYLYAHQKLKTFSLTELTCGAG